MAQARQRPDISTRHAVPSATQPLSEQELARLNVLVSERKLDALENFHRHSVHYRSAIAEILLMHCEILVDCACKKQLDQLLMFARSLLSPADLSKLAIATAAKADRCDELTSVLRYLDDIAEDQTFLQCLYDAAGQSGDPRMLELTVSYDRALTQQLERTPGVMTHHSPRLNRLLALSVQAGSGALKEKLLQHGAVIHASDPALKGLPLFAILADNGDLLLLKSHFRQAPEQLNKAIKPIKSGSGLMTVFKAFQSSLRLADMNALLCHAARLGDADTITLLVDCFSSVGCSADVLRRQSTHTASLPTPISTALRYGKAHVLEPLLRLGWELEPAQLETIKKSMPKPESTPDQDAMPPLLYPY